MTQQTASPATVPYDVYQRERTRRIEAERDRDRWKNEFYLQRDIRRAPVLQPITKAVLEECRHVETWGTVKAPDGSTRANYTTIAKHLKTSPDTVARQAQRLEKLGLIDIQEHQGPKDERDRKYIHVREEKLRSLDQLADPEKVMPKQGGNRYACQACGSTHVAKRTVSYLKCLEPECGHETILDDSGYKEQNVQKQLAFEQEAAQDVVFSTSDETPLPHDEKQNAEHCVYTLPLDAEPASQKQLAFDELKALPIWCPHRAKVPYNVVKSARVYQLARSDTPATWATYERAQAVYAQSHREGWKHPFDGIGMMNTGDYVFLDIDTCRNKETGGLTDAACELVVRFPTYWEISQSGTGLHGIARGALPAGVKESGVIEMYPGNRFFVWTGNHLDGTLDTIEDCQGELSALYAELRPAARPDDTPGAITPFYTSHCSDAEILAKARKSSNGAKFCALYDEGSIDGYGGDDSRADLALCRLLAYWTDRNVPTIDRLFRDSKLMRDKWDRSVGRGETYGERTIRRALGEQERRAS